MDAPPREGVGKTRPPKVAWNAHRARRPGPGVPNGKAKKDKCAICDTDVGNDCKQDCSGTWGDKTKKTQCGSCDTNADDNCVQDCAGTW